MNIVNKDTRELTDVTPINFQARKITFFEMKITWNFAWDIEDMVQWNFYFVWEDTKKISLNNDTEVFDMWWNFFVVEYFDENLRNQDIALLKQNFQENWKFAKELEEKRQIPTFDWYFEHEWKYYIIVNGLNKLTDEINSEKGIYKWVIVNPSKYFEVENEVKNVVWKIDDIL